MHWLAMTAAWCVLSTSAWADPNEVRVVKDAGGSRLQVDGADFFVLGMNWEYMPIGQNYSYDFWGQSDAFIEDALRPEMAMLSRMGVNSIRQYPGIPPRWVTWIYDNYGITTMINPLVGRYGLTVDGRWVPVVDYSNPRHREVIKTETLALVEQYKDVRGILLVLLGNENNYGLSWSSFEIEALPKGDQQAARATFLYSLYGELADAIHTADPHHPVAIANGDLQYLDLVEKYAPNIDIFGSNVYRGMGARDLFEVVDQQLHKPVLFTEFGADAYDAKAHREDDVTQARYLLSQWQELYEQSAGHGGVGNAIGGYTFQWSDGWWKYLQEESLDVHDTHASWPNGGYVEDSVEGENNMNEEWFGITAKGLSDADGHYRVYPRTAYYVLREAYELDPYDPGTTLPAIRQHFAAIEPADYASRYTADTALLEVERVSRATVEQVRLELSTFTTSQNVRDGGLVTPAFDHMESFYTDFAVRPTDTFTGTLSVNILGHVAQNRIDDIFYENRGRDLSVVGFDGTEVGLSALERVKIYRAKISWETDDFDLNGFYREGHYHWGYEGDFFGLYREAYYGPSIDTYDADVPIGFELSGHGALDGVKVALGPELYWGANPAVVAKVREPVGRFTVTLMHWEDVATKGDVESSNAIPEPMSRKSTVAVETKAGPLGLEAGGIFAGSNKVGEDFLYVRDAAGSDSYQGSGLDVLNDQIAIVDTLGGKLKTTLQVGRLNWYLQGGYRGLVADGGGDPTRTFTGWSLKEDGRGNQFNVLSGAAVNLGHFQVAPNFLYQKPLIGPLPSVADAYDPKTGWYYPQLRARNVFDDPFAVLDNRETTGFELLLALDPTPGTWMWSWDNDLREDAQFAVSVDAVYRLQPTSRDAGIGFTADGTMFTFSSAPSAHDVWDIKTRAVSLIRPDLRLINHLYVGTAQANGDDERIVTHYGGDLTLWWKTSALFCGVKIDDWGPYDYNRDYNLTYPLQLFGDLSFGLMRPRLDGTGTRFGVSAKYRTLDQHSEGYVPGSGGDGAYGQEIEIGTYARVAM